MPTAKSSLAMNAARVKLPFTVRGLMLAVVISALALTCWRWLVEIRRRLDRDPYVASRTISKSWSLGIDPSIEVDLFEGSIQVLPSDDGNTSARIGVATVSQSSQASADQALEALKFDLIALGENLRIGASRAHGQENVATNIDVIIYVPGGVRLDLQTRGGEIRVGQDYAANATFHLPVATSSIVARNLSPRRLGYAEGNIVVETAVPSDSGVVTLLLEAPGRIDIRANNALITALAHGGALQPQRVGGLGDHSQEDPEEGSIIFEGSLSGGHSSFRADRSIELLLPPEASFNADLEATWGKTVSEFRGQPLVAAAANSKRLEAVGLDPQRSNSQVK